MELSPAAAVYVHDQIKKRPLVSSALHVAGSQSFRCVDCAAFLVIKKKQTTSGIMMPRLEAVVMVMGQF